MPRGVYVRHQHLMAVEPKPEVGWSAKYLAYEMLNADTGEHIGFCNLSRMSRMVVEFRGQSEDTRHIAAGIIPAVIFGKADWRPEVGG